MMTDEQLATIKARVENSHSLLPRGALAMIARLEAAEAVCRLEEVWQKFDYTEQEAPPPLKDALEAWRKARGVES